MGFTAAGVGSWIGSVVGGVSATSVAAGAAAVSAGVGLASVLTRPGAPKPQTLAPLPDQASLQLADQKAAALTIGRTGRASTVLSQTPASDQLGP